MGYKWKFLKRYAQSLPYANRSRKWPTASDSTNRFERGDMSSLTQSQPKVWLIEKLLALITAIVCLVISIYIWQLVAGQQSMWPLPELYLIEIPALCVIVAAITVREPPDNAIPTWVAFGAILAFSILASLSIGIYYYPIVILLLVAAILSIWRAHRSALLSIVWAVAAALVQVGIIYIGVILT